MDRIDQTNNNTTPSISNNMNSLQLSCRKNNEGVELLVNQKPQEAMLAFQDALASIKNAVNDEHVEAPSSESISSSEQIPIEPIKSVLSIQASTTSAGLSAMACTYVYDKPIVLQETSMSNDQESMLTFYSAAVLFNLALACHQVGRNGKESALKRAALLYRMSSQLLQNCQANGVTGLGATPVILSLLALNNRAQIHYEHCDYGVSSQCLREMSRVLTDAHFLYSALPEADVEGLLLNVMLLEAPSAAQAA